MNKLKTQFLLLIILSSFSLQLFPEEKSFNFNEDHLELSKEIVRILETEHYSKKEFSSIKRESFNLFLERLDPNKIIFLDREIKNYLDAVENNSSDELENSLKLAFEAFRLFQTRYRERNEFQVGLLERIEDLNLRQSKRILKDRSKALSPRTVPQLRDLWESALIDDVIKLSLSGNDFSETQDKLNKRLKSSFNYFNKTISDDVFDIYINSVSSIYGPHTSYMSPKRSEDFD